MSVSGGDSNLASQLHTWASREMHYRPRGRHVNSSMPTNDDFRDICRGSMNDIWKFVLENVHSAQTVRKVQGNLRLQSLQQSKGYRVKYKGEPQNYSEEKADLLEKRKKLSVELTSTLSAIGHVEKDLERLKKDITSVETSYKASSNRYRDTQKRTALLRAHSLHVQGEAAKYDEYTGRIKDKGHKLSALAKKGGEEGVLYSKQSTAMEQKDSHALETASMRSVRECCEEIGSFLQQLLQGSFAEDKNLMSKKKESLWRQTENSSREYPASQVLGSLCLNATDSAGSLKERTTRIDIKKDAEKLRFKYENSGQLRDLSSTTTESVLQSVHQLLQEAHGNNIKRFVETEKCKNHSWKLRQRLQESSDIVDGYMKQRYREDEGALEMARKLFQCEIQASADRAALRTLQDVAGNLREQINIGIREKEMLFGKYQKIQDFKKVADSKQSLIHVLVKQNVNARSRLEAQQQEIQQYVLSSMSSHQADTHSGTDALQNTVIGEVEAFAGLSLPYLMFTTTDGTYRTAIVDLSIHRLYGNPSTPAGQALCTLMEAVHFPLYKAPEYLLPTMTSLQREQQDIEAALVYQRCRALECGDDHKAMANRIQVLCKEVGSHDKKQLEKVLPMLQKRLAQTTQALTECLGVRDTAAAWWEQPSQNACPWMKVGDLTLQQWKDKWTVDITRLRQAQIK